MKRNFWLLAILLIFLGHCGNPDNRVKPSGTNTVPFQPSPYYVDDCRLDINLEPATHRLEGTATLTIMMDRAARSAPTAKLRLQLHRNLGLDSITCQDQPVRFQRLPYRPPTTQPAEQNPKELLPAMYELDWRPPNTGSAILTIRYGGLLQQEVLPQEKTDATDNHSAYAYIGEDGIYLGENSAWFPQIPGLEEESGPREPPLTKFELRVTDPPGMVLVSCGNRVDAKHGLPRGSQTRWQMPWPTRGLTMAGGRHQVFQRQVGEVLISVHVIPEHANVAPALLEAIAATLRLYQPLLGKYPYAEFTVFENFFNAGSSFPGFTTLSPAVIATGDPSRRSAVLDHELLHNWWGHGVCPSALDGNWSEALTSYCANYMRPILEGRPLEARAQRRDICAGLTDLPANEDQPLATFGRRGGAGAFIGHQKGTLVLAMLADRIGQATTWRSLRRLYEEHLGRPTTWKDIQDVFEQESRQSLADFFNTWVRGSRVPALVIDEASYDSRGRRLALTIQRRDEPLFDVNVPVRMVFNGSGRAEDMITSNRATQVILLRSMIPPTYIQLDPDYRVLRRLAMDEAIPAMTRIGPPRNLLIVRHEADGEAYAPLIEQLKARYHDTQDIAVRMVEAAQLQAEDFAQGHIMLLGQACLTPLACEQLHGTPLAFDRHGFIVGQQRYQQPDHEVLCCVNNHLLPGAVIGLYYGNEVTRLKKLHGTAFEDNHSLVVFENGNAVVRQDFEPEWRLEVLTAP